MQIVREPDARTILVPVDLSRRSEGLVLRGIDLFGPKGMRLVLLHLVSVSDPSHDNLFRSTVSRQYRESIIGLKRCRAEILARYGTHPGFRVDTMAHFDTPHAIADCARDVAADIVVMQAPRRKGWRGIFRRNRITALVDRLGTTPLVLLPEDEAVPVPAIGLPFRDRDGNA